VNNSTGATAGVERRAIILLPVISFATRNARRAGNGRFRGFLGIWQAYGM
jgi:hypothetical protein